MTLSLDDLTTPMTVTEVKDSIYRVFTAQGVDTTSWKAGAVVRTIVTAVSLPLSGMSYLVSYMAKSAFLDSAEDAWLRAKAKYDYLGDDTEALIPEATYARGFVDIVNGGGGIYSWDAGDEICSNSVTGKTYLAVEAVSLGAGATLEDVEVIAAESGSDSNADAGDIDTIIPSAVGVVVSNPAMVTASDPPSDPQIREICRERSSSLSPNGPRDAYNYFAKATTLNGVSVGVTRVATVPGPNYVTAYVATSAGGVAGDQDDPTTPLGAVRRNLMLNCVPIGVDLDLQSAGTTSLGLDYTAWVYSDCSLTDAEIKAQAATNLAQLFSNSPIGGYKAAGVGSGGYIFADAIVDQVRNVSNDVIRVSRTSGHVDVAVNAGTVPVIAILSGTIIRQERNI